MSTQPTTEEMDRGQQKTQGVKPGDVKGIVTEHQKESDKLAQGCFESFCCCFGPCCQFEEQEEQREKYRQKQAAKGEKPTTLNPGGVDLAGK
jgi:hypothetical protein